MLRSFNHYVKGAKFYVKEAMFTAKKAALKLNKSKVNNTCPICGYTGPFMDINRVTGERKQSQCPECRSFERHRLQKLVMDKLSKEYNFSEMSILHIAPEPYFRELFKKLFKKYVSGDLERTDVDINVDLTKMPFADGEFDFIYASHVLEHIPEDDKALKEIKRVLKPGGLAILEVPIVAYKTIDYDKAYESGHVRAPGFDYYDKYKNYFKEVEQITSNDFPEIYQTHLIERRDLWPTAEVPLRKPMFGEKHLSIVPICHA